MSRAPAPRRGPRLTLWLSADSRLAQRDLPGRRRLAAWIRAAIGARRGWFALSLRLAGRREARALNRRFRGRDYAPNVLAFPAGPGPARPRPLGDLLLCLPVARAEARAQGK
ncbi:MAG: rRNA maturation RNAse YbeY, partial [Elioraea sp.]|nr:rRNA maturation RNAse YbeY [Elioraea sp.]